MDNRDDVDHRLYGHAANQPTEKDLRVLDVGTARVLVILELGAPAETRIENGAKEDLFSFI